MLIASTQRTVAYQVYSFIIRNPLPSAVCGGDSEKELIWTGSNTFVILNFHLLDVLKYRSEITKDKLL